MHNIEKRLWDKYFFNINFSAAWILFNFYEVGKMSPLIYMYNIQYRLSSVLFILSEPKKVFFFCNVWVFHFTKHSLGNSEIIKKCIGILKEKNRTQRLKQRV